MIICIDMRPAMPSVVVDITMTHVEHMLFSKTTGTNGQIRPGLFIRRDWLQNLTASKRKKLVCHPPGIRLRLLNAPAVFDITTVFLGELPEFLFY